MKKLILSICDSSYRCLHHISGNNHKEYADKWNWEYRHIDLESKAIVWDKLIIMAELLNTYDVIFWIDVDIFITNMDIDIFQSLDKDASITIGAQVLPDGQLWDGFTPITLHTGAFMIRNTKFSKRFLPIWSSYRDLFKDIHYPMKEESALDMMYLENLYNCRANIKLISLNRLFSVYPCKSVLSRHEAFHQNIHKKGDFIIHFLEMDLAEREKAMAGFNKNLCL